MEQVGSVLAVSRQQFGSVLSESGRVEAFSDGVLAIAITLLVLDLRAPEEQRSFAGALLHQWPTYLAYLASFAYIGVIWVNHHHLFARIKLVNSGLLWRNLALLLGVSALSFPTAVVSSAFQNGDRPDERAALLLYAAVAAFTVGSWLSIYHFLSRRPELLEKSSHADFFALERRRAVVGLAAYGVCALVAFLSPISALVLACLLPVFYAVSSEGIKPEPPSRR
ncbi:TMEM175 family protein [Streptomyces sp. NPDC094468]|uniref:TMEM175 family protein n=1 Tax=Streptomyces sp. NPDC094468 TaxID=3366066 RepID=UPI00381B3911